MQQVVFDEPYEFVPPAYSDWWPAILRPYLRRHLRKAHGVHSVECRQVERLRASLAAGRSIVLTPNHCRFADPMVLGVLAQQADCHLFAMGSWHLFKQGWYQRTMIRLMGAFSLLREGNDRQAIDTAIDIVVSRKRPLVMFPEGALTRHNDIVEEMMDGPSFIARQAAKRLRKSGQAGEVVIHPVAIRYAFQGDLEATLTPVIDEFEARFSWQPQRHLSLVERIGKIGNALLALKEVEYLGTARAGNLHERTELLVQELLAGLESKWQIKDTSGSVIARVKRLRTALLAEMIAGRVTPDERAERWRDLAACYYAQQLSHYPRDYVQPNNNFPEHVVETVERFEEDFTGRLGIHGPFHSVIQVGEAIPVGTHRDRNAGADPIMAEVKRQLQSMIDGMAAERTPV
ncbi:MAG: 1-acyl-sn-glycerol-3-phosphate acyltransferase [Planctomycetes bacterium]|nr:1-acyl-sn-glycerol-3-phosphate acyltransferase [Planctomycetota bacterium]